MKTLMFSNHAFGEPFFLSANQHKHDLSFTEKPLTMDTVSMAKGFRAITLFTSDNGSAQILDTLSDLGIQYIALRSAGYDHVDVTKAKSLGIHVANAPAYSPYSIAEHSVALLMALNRRLVLGHQLIQQNDFRLDQLVGFDLYGKTVGIVGTGKIGSAFASIMHGFGCRLLAYDIEENAALIKKTNIVYTTFDELCRSADIVSVHCPLNDATRYLFRKESFSRMKPGVVFINTSRGGIVNTSDLLEALDHGIIANAGLDVYEYEKPIFFQDHGSSRITDELFQQVLRHPRILLTGHQAFLTHEALTGIAEATIGNLDAWEKFQRSPNDLA